VRWVRDQRPTNGSVHTVAVRADSGTPDRASRDGCLERLGQAVPQELPSVVAREVGLSATQSAQPIFS
jgi:hypothetical protein